MLTALDRITRYRAEKAVYESIEKDLDARRRFRDELGTLGYVGGEYTKKSAGDRAEYEAALKKEKQQQGIYARAEDMLIVGASRRYATP